MGNDGKGVRRLTLRVGEDRAGQKVDTLLRKELGLSGTVIRRIKWLPEGILLDGERVFTGGWRPDRCSPCWWPTRSSAAA